MRLYKQLLEKIMQNKKYKALSETLVEEAIKNYFKEQEDQVRYLTKPRSKQYKKIVSTIRGNLHNIHGSFQNTKKSKRNKYLKQLPSLQAHKDLLQTNKSTQERQKSYLTLYKELFNETGKPKSILDLGCGLNPVSYYYIEAGRVKYYAYDIDKEDVQFLNSYFEKMKMKGEAKVLDLRKISNVKKLPKADVAFLFNVLDPLEKGKGHKYSEELIQNLKAEHIIVSFSTKTLSGKQMNHPYRGWIERMLTRIKMPYKRLFFENEIFYVINTHKK